MGKPRIIIDDGNGNVTDITTKGSLGAFVGTEYSKENNDTSFFTVGDELTEKDMIKLLTGCINRFIIHGMQKGYSPERIVRNYKTADKVAMAALGQIIKDMKE